MPAIIAAILLGSTWMAPTLLVSELDVFLLAVRATITEEAAVWVYKPRP